MKAPTVALAVVLALFAVLHAANGTWTLTGVYAGLAVYLGAVAVQLHDNEKRIRDLRARLGLVWLLIDSATKAANAKREASRG